MLANLSLKTGEVLAYLVGFAAVAVPGTMLLICSEVQVESWKLALLMITELSSGEAMRSGFLHIHKKGTDDEYR